MADEPVTEQADDETAPTSAVDLMKGGGARIASDGLGPSLAFYLGWKLSGLGLGVAFAFVAAVVACLLARRAGRRGLLPWIAVIGVAIQGVIGLVAGDAKGFFGPQIVASFVWGLAFVGSVVIRRPLVGVFARELFPMPDEIRDSDGYLRLTSILSLVFGVSILVRGVLRYLQLRNGSIDGFLLLTIATGPPVTAVTIVWGLWFSRRALARLDASRGILPA
jgi:hypothetical protein